jgi:hypothetical protein
MTSKDSKWWKNINGAKEHEAIGDWKGGGVLWADSEASSWFISANHKQFPDYCVYNEFVIIFQNCDCKDETVNTSTT